MTKVVKAKLKILVPGGAATPAPPVGSSLGQHGVKIMDFCKEFNAQTANRKGEVVPVLVTIYANNSFSFEIKTAPATALIKKRAGITKGSSRPHQDKVGKITWKDVEEIAQIKMADLNAFTMDQAKKIIAGSAQSMGVEVID